MPTVPYVHKYQTMNSLLCKNRYRWVAYRRVAVGAAEEDPARYAAAGADVVPLVVNIQSHTITKLYKLSWTISGHTENKLFLYEVPTDKNDQKPKLWS